MNFEETKVEFLNKIIETFNRLDTPCVIAKEDADGFNKLNFEQDWLKKTQYFFSIFQAGEEIIGIKVKWVIGEVVDDRNVATHLYGNTVRYLRLGPLFAGILPINNGNDCLFLLLGNLLFPSSVSSSTAAQIMFFWAFNNYIIDPLNKTIPGVRIYWE